MRFDDENSDPILLAIGAASMCWEPTPTGIFDSDKALEVANELKRCLLKGIEEEEEKTMSSNHVAFRWKYIDGSYVLQWRCATLPAVVDSSGTVLEFGGWTEWQTVPTVGPGPSEYLDFLST